MITVPLLVAVIGLILYIWSPEPRVTEVGRICFFCGLLVTLFGLAGRALM